MEEYEKSPWSDGNWVDKKDICVSPEFENVTFARVAVGERDGEGYHDGLEGGALFVEFEDTSATNWRVTVQDYDGKWYGCDTPRRVRIEVAGCSEVENLKKSFDFISEHLGQLPNWFDPFSPEMLKAKLDEYKKAGLLDEGMETRELLDILQMQEEAKK